MIRREHIKQAIDAISGRSPEIGYSLDELLGMGLIDAVSGQDDPNEGENFYFLFEGQKVLVNRVLFFNAGIAPIEQGLLIKYGELVKKHELQDKGATVGYQDAYRQIHKAGLHLVVMHEIDYAISRLKKRLGTTEGEGKTKKSGDDYRELIAALERMKQDGGASAIPEDVSFLYQGIVDVATPAYFTRFPINIGSLMQVADINVEFFHVRFVLNCLLRGLERNLMACVAERSIVGLTYVALKEQFLTRDLEIKYLATLAGKTWDEAEAARKPLKGVGTFLVAGVWMLLKTEMERVRDIVLDSEVGARQFYESVGFESRGLSGYILKQPKAYLLKAILGMAYHCRDLKEGVIGEIKGLIRKQVKWLRKKVKTEKQASERKAVIACVKECLGPMARPEFTEAALNNLLRYRKKIGESEELIGFAMAHAPDEVKATIHAAAAHR